MIHTTEWLMIAGTGALAAYCWRKDATWIAFLLLASSAIYFLPSVVMMFDGSPMDNITALRQSGSSHIIKALAVVTVAASLLLLTGGASRAAMPRPIPTALSFMLLIGMFTLDTAPDSQGVINTLSLVGMLLLIGAGANALGREVMTRTRSENSARFLAAALSLLLLISVGLALYEISSGMAWASFYTVDELMVVRASSLFFNPNLFGLFCTMLAIYFGFRWHKASGVQQNFVLLSGIFLAGLGIYLASSRSLGCLLLLFLVVTGLLLPTGTRSRFTPALVYLLALLLAATLSIAWWNLDGQGSAKHFWVLAMRLVDSPIQILAVALRELGFSMDGDFANMMLKPETVIAVEGRFLGEERDSGLLTAYDDSGWLGVCALVVFWLYALWLGVHAYLHQRTVETTYALATAGFCLAIGALMRYQVYPVWVWVALMLSPCFALWRVRLGSSGVLRWAYP